MEKKEIFKTHYKQLMHPDYIGAYALQPGEERTVKIKSVGEETVIGTNGQKEPCLVCHLEDEKPMILNSTNAKTIAKLFSTPYIEDWIGREFIIYATPVKAFGETVEALRVRPILPKNETISPDRFNKMITAIKAGKFKAEEALTRFALTKNQVESLQEYLQV